MLKKLRSEQKGTRPILEPKDDLTKKSFPIYKKNHINRSDFISKPFKFGNAQERGYKLNGNNAK